MKHVRWCWLLVFAACKFSTAYESAEPGDAEPIDADAATVGSEPDAPVMPFAMAGQRWHLPCSNNLGNRNCNCATGPQIETVVLAGKATERWVVTVRIRGIMEAITYTGGIAGLQGWYLGGAKGDTANNYYRMVVSSPAATYWINRGTPTGQRSFVYDYMASLAVDGNATIMFESNGQDGLQWGNYDAAGAPQTIANVPTNPSPYDGQFAQLDVVSVALAQ